jgi:hypothetical protein
LRHGRWHLAKHGSGFALLYPRRGRAPIALEKLLRVSLIQTLFSIHSERRLAQHIEYKLLYRWFVGMEYPVDGTQIEVWVTSSVKKDGSIGEWLRPSYATEPDARLYKKAEGTSLV